MSWLAIGLLAAGAFGFKAAGVLWTPKGGQARLTTLIPAALFAGLVVVLIFEKDQSIVIDARVAGAVAAGIAAWKKAGFMVVVLVAMLVTTVVRAVA